MSFGNFPKSFLHFCLVFYIPFSRRKKKYLLRRSRLVTFFHGRKKVLYNPRFVFLQSIRLFPYFFLPIGTKHYGVGMAQRKTSQQKNYSLFESVCSLCVIKL